MNYSVYYSLSSRPLIIPAFSNLSRQACCGLLASFVSTIVVRSWLPKIDPSLLPQTSNIENELVLHGIGSAVGKGWTEWGWGFCEIYSKWVRVGELAFRFTRHAGSFDGSYPCEHRVSMAAGNPDSNCSPKISQWYDQVTGHRALSFLRRPFDSRYLVWWRVISPSMTLRLLSVIRAGEGISSSYKSASAATLDSFNHILHLLIKEPDTISVMSETQLVVADALASDSFKVALSAISCIFPSWPGWNN